MSTVNEFLNAFCEETGMDKEAMRASTNRTTAKKIMAEVAKFNGLNPEEFTEQFKELMSDINRYSSTGATRITYKYTQRPVMITEKGELAHDAMEDSEIATPKYSPSDYTIQYKVGSATSFENCKSKKSVSSFKKLLGSTYAPSILRELGYKVDKQTVQSPGKYQRLFDVVTIDWTEGRK